MALAAAARGARVGRAAGAKAEADATRPARARTRAYIFFLCYHCFAISMAEAGGYTYSTLSLLLLVVYLIPNARCFRSWFVSAWAIHAAFVYRNRAHGAFAGAEAEWITARVSKMPGRFGSALLHEYY